MMSISRLGLCQCLNHRFNFVIRHSFSIERKHLFELLSRGGRQWESDRDAVSLTGLDQIAVAGQNRGPRKAVLTFAPKTIRQRLGAEVLATRLLHPLRWITLNAERQARPFPGRHRWRNLPLNQVFEISKTFDRRHLRDVPPTAWFSVRAKPGYDGDLVLVARRQAVKFKVTLFVRLSQSQTGLTVDQ